MTLEQRIAKLERANTRLKTAVIGCVFMAGLLILLGADHAKDAVTEEVNTKRVNIYDASGTKIAAVLEGDKQGRGTLRFLNDGKTAIFLGLDSSFSRGLAIYNPKKKRTKWSLYTATAASPHMDPTGNSAV